MVNKVNEDETVILASSECQEGIMETINSKNKPDFTVTKASVSFHEKCLIISWETVSAGFGELTFFHDKFGKLVCDNECMSKRFIIEVFAKLNEELKILS